MFAQGKIFEASSRTCAAQNDLDGFVSHSESAIEAFLEVNRVADASRVMLRMGQHVRAAGR